MAHRIRLTGKGYDTFTGNDFCGIDFVNGISVNPVPQVFANRIAAIVPCELIKEDGSSDGQAGVQRELVGLYKRGVAVAEVVKPLARQSDEDRANEEKSAKAKAFKPSAEQIKTREQLEDIVKVSGIKGLREVGNIWGVKDRSIPKLIGEILKAQVKYQASAASLAAERRQVQDREMMKAVEAAKAKEAELSATARNLSSPEELHKTAIEKSRIAEALVKEEVTAADLIRDNPPVDTMAPSTLDPAGISDAIGEGGENASTADKPKKTES